MIPLKLMFLPYNPRESICFYHTVIDLEKVIKIFKFVCLVSLLVRAGARADQHNEDLGLSPIHVATLENNLTAVKILLDNPRNKASVNSMMRNGRTALHLASERGNTELMQVLLDQPDLQNVDAEDLMGRQTPSFLAAKNGNLAAVKLLLEYGASLKNSVQNKSLEVYLSEKFPQLRPETVSVRVKPRESSEQAGLPRLLKNC